ncbi:MAG: Tex family protein [Longimicrobiales bacterium]|nr:Tex family protein [Longimicrobiales bacterium]
MSLKSTATAVARELSLPRESVTAALALFDEGNTLPFVARYRKERTGGLDEVQLREIRERAGYLAELDERRSTILASIEEQGELTPELRKKIEAADTKQELEDLYEPFRPRRRTRATMAQERGLEPLADRIWDGQVDDRGARKAAAEWIAARDADSEVPDAASEVPDADAALQGARDILAERVARDVELRSWARGLMREKGTVTSRVKRGKKDDPAAPQFRDYFGFSEPVRKVAHHRILAMRRGESEGILAWGVEAPEEVPARVGSYVEGRGPARTQLRLVAEDAWSRLLHPSLESSIKSELVEGADEEAIRIFGVNLENLLLQPPAGQRRVLGLDPGFRTGVKVAMVSATGAVLDTGILYLHQEEGFREGLRELVREHRPELIAVGNGTASRETDAAVREALEGAETSGSDEGSDGPDRPAVVLVNEAGASVYSASELGARELPDLDVSLRGAVSIARRLQDPLAELVKIDPRSIGVGQYQHDVDQSRLTERLDHVVERCVNRVGVEVNTASAPLLSYVAGIGPTLAANLVELRDERGGLSSRRELLDVPRLGAKTFEQAAGFLRIRDGDHPLDATAVHPERYELVERMARDLGTDVGGLVENPSLVDALEKRLERYVSGGEEGGGSGGGPSNGDRGRGSDIAGSVGGDAVGMPTLKDIVAELRRPGRDPRDAFEPPSFRDDVREPSDLEPGMVLQGVVTNVVAFGAFVDVGVHQDGLVHISELADRFVKDPNTVVKVGQPVKVKVLKVDLDRGRIGLSMKRVG